MDNQNESSVIQLIEAVMWYVDEHVEDAGTADNINCALHGIVNKLGGTIEEPPRYKAMRKNVKEIIDLLPVPQGTFFDIEAFKNSITPIHPDENGVFTCPYCGIQFKDSEFHVCWVGRK